MGFPLFKTKIEGLDQTFDLLDPIERQKYFQAKAGEEIDKLAKYLQKNTFIAYVLAKKNAGKGTCIKLFMEIFGMDKVAHLSIGDIVRAVHQEAETEEGRVVLKKFLEREYRGYLSVEKTLEVLFNRDTKSLLPTEFILALLKREVGKIGKKALFIDGFPRGLDQVSYSLFFRDLVDYRQDPDFFVMIDIPDSIIDARMKGRVVCPLCQTARNLKVFPTLEAGFEERTGQFYLCCDNPDCHKVRMMPKEGDELGIQAIRDRLDLDQQLIDQAFSLYGIGKVLLRNSLPASLKDQYVDDYEVTPEYSYKWDPVTKEVLTETKPWVVNDDNGVPSYSLLAPPVTVAMMKQMVDVLDL